MAADSKMLAGWLPGHDARWVIATVLVVAGLLWMKSDGLSRRIDDLRADVNNQIGLLAGQMAELRTDVRRIDDRLRAVEIRLRAVEVRLRAVDDRLRAVETAVMPAPPPPGD